MRGRIFQSEHQLHGPSFVFTSNYDNADRMTQTTLPTGRIIETRYDGLSRVVEVPGLIDHVAYRFSGEPERIERSNGTVDTMTYDVRLRLDGRGVDGPGATSLLTRTLVRDRISMVTDVVDAVVRDPGTPSADATYTYDAAYRVIEAYFERSRSAPPNASGYMKSLDKTGLSSYASPMELTIEIEREDDGRWIAEVLELPGVLAYGSDRDAAIRAAETLALRVLTDRLEHGEPVPEPFKRDG
ncbi:MAG: type II toxin-antitoxin system HicB family antitoxin [Myxococcota bacterium]